MGSKTSLLRGDLGDLLLQEAAKHERFFDLFSGSGAVSHHVATQLPLEVISCDIQSYAAVLAGSIVTRTDPADTTDLLSWVKRAHEIHVRQHENVADESNPESDLKASDVIDQREKSVRHIGAGFITRDYGGHYFSYAQARALDVLYEEFPRTTPLATVALAALIQAASRCSASPGHTAQPFQPSPRLLPHISQLWSRDPFDEVLRALDKIAPRHALRRGAALKRDAFAATSLLKPTDLVFLDPPYSAAQYSRFYHVLEGIAIGGWRSVDGAGRMPARTAREGSAYSTTKAPFALARLLEALHRTGATVMMTFPDALTSNRLSGSAIAAMSALRYSISVHRQMSFHSTLGGRSQQGRGRKAIAELILVLRPR